MPRRSLFVTSVTLLAVAVAASLVGCSRDDGGPAEVGTASGGRAVQVYNARISPSPADDGSASGYFTVRNTGDHPDRLIEATVEGAGSTMMHRSVVRDGRSTMEMESSVPVPAKGRLRFEPGGRHLMITGLPKDRSIGDHVGLRLDFERAGTIRVQVELTRGSTH